MGNGRGKAYYQGNRDKKRRHPKSRASNTILDALSTLSLDTPIERSKPNPQPSRFPRLQRAFGRKGMGNSTRNPLLWQVKPTDLRRLMRQLKRRTPNRQAALPNISSRIATMLGRILDDHNRSGVSQVSAFTPRSPADAAKFVDSITHSWGKPFRQDPSFRDGPPLADTVNGISFTKLMAFRDQMRREQQHAVPQRMGYAVPEQDPGFMLQEQVPENNVNGMAAGFPRAFGQQSLDYTLGNMRL